MRATPTQNRRRMSSCSGFRSSAVIVRGSGDMPHFGHAPGSERTISGCIGQVYSVRTGGDTNAGSRDMPHFGQLPGPCWRISGCMGQVYSTAVAEAAGASDGSSVFRR